LPESFLANCLKECGLTIQDLVDANMRNIVEKEVTLPPPRFASAEEIMEKVEKSLRNQSVVTLKQAVDILQRKTTKSSNKPQLEKKQRLEKFRSLWEEQMNLSEKNLKSFAQHLTRKNIA